MPALPNPSSKVRAGLRQLRKSVDTRRRLQWANQQSKVVYRGYEAYAGYIETINWNPYSTAADVLARAGIHGTKRPVPFPRWPQDAKRTPYLTEILQLAADGVWADFGCGLQLAQTEFEQKHPELAAKIGLLGVDFFHWTVSKALKGCKLDEPGTPELIEGMRKTLRQSNATQLLGDLTKVTLPQKADVITSIEVVQYIEDKIAMLCHWHNQLRIGGVAIITTETGWLHWIRTHGTMFRDGMPTRVLQQMKALGVDIGLFYGSECYDEFEFQHAADAHYLVMRRTSDVELQSVAKLRKIWCNPNGYLASEYDASPMLVVPKQEAQKAA